MASVHIGANTSIEYNITNGRVREFTLFGETLYDRDAGVEVSGWENKLVEVVMAYNWHEDDGYGKRAFVYWLEDQGYLPISQH